MSDDLTPRPTRGLYLRLDANGAVIGHSKAPVPWDDQTAAHLGLTAVTPEIYSQAMNAAPSSTIIYSNGAVTITAPAPPALATVQAQACDQIDAIAESVRRQFITPGSGQAMVYEAKGNQAAAFLAAYPTSTAAAGATATAWPLLTNEVGVTGATLFEVAWNINAKATQWHANAAQIEKLRLTAKRQIMAAATSAEVAAIKITNWPAPS